MGGGGHPPELRRYAKFITGSSPRRRGLLREKSPVRTIAIAWTDRALRLTKLWRPQVMQNRTRRQFLLTSTAALAGASIPSFAAAPTPSGPDADHVLSLL